MSLEVAALFVLFRVIRGSALAWLRAIHELHETTRNLAHRRELRTNTNKPMRSTRAGITTWMIEFQVPAALKTDLSRFTISQPFLFARECPERAFDDIDDCDRRPSTRLHAIRCLPLRQVSFE